MIDSNSVRPYRLKGLFKAYAHTLNGQLIIFYILVMANNKSTSRCREAISRLSESANHFIALNKSVQKAIYSMQEVLKSFIIGQIKSRTTESNDLDYIKKHLEIIDNGTSWRVRIYEYRHHGVEGAFLHEGCDIETQINNGALTVAYLLSTNFFDDSERN